MWSRPGRIPLVFEALPTDVRATPAEREFHLDLMRPLRILDVDAINVPEIIGGAYETVPPREFAAGLQQVTGLPAIVNRITVQEPADGLRRWIQETRTQHDIHDFVLVGGESSKESYSGPGVTEGLRIARDAGADRLGVITIPTRRRPDLDEPHRLLAKQEAGADYAISQILGESESAARLQRDTAQAAVASDVPCPPILWSLAPVARIKDLKFLQWLGVEIPAAYERRLRSAGGAQSRLEVSHQTNEAMARNLLEHAEREEHGPIGFCIEHVMRSNMAPAFELVERIRDVILEFKAAPLPSSQ